MLQRHLQLRAIIDDFSFCTTFRQSNNNHQYFPQKNNSISLFVIDRQRLKCDNNYKFNVNWPVVCKLEAWLLQLKPSTIIINLDKTVVSIYLTAMTCFFALLTKSFLATQWESLNSLSWYFSTAHGSLITLIQIEKQSHQIYVCLCLMSNPLYSFLMVRNQLLE